MNATKLKQCRNCGRESDWIRRGLCRSRTCYTNPSVRERFRVYIRPHPSPERGAHKVCLWMELLSGLGMHPRRSLRFNEWWKLLASLDPADARVLVLRLLHGLEWEEIGERLEVSGARVGQRYGRAIRRLRLSETVAAALCA